MMEPEIMKAALLGTDQYVPDIGSVGPDIFRKIQALETGKEDRFLKAAYAALRYQEAGAQPVAIDFALPECPPEARPYAGDRLTALIHAALKDKGEVLFRYYLYRIAKSEKVLPSWLVPMVLNKALEAPKDRADLLEVCGEAGKWLCSLNPKWAAMALPDTEAGSTWETGTLEQRKVLLTHVRKTDPASAIALLETTLAEENAANRLIFVQLLAEGLSISDEPFLQKLTTDKSQKVKEAAFDLLKQIPGSALNSAYLQALTNLLEVREERHLLVTKKKMLGIRADRPLDDALFKTGIDKVSKERGVDDHVYQAAQLLAFTDPAQLAPRLGMSDQELISALLHFKAAGVLVPFLVRSAVLYGNKAWSLALLHRDEATDIRLLDALEENERSAFYGKFLQNSLMTLLTYLFDDGYTPLPVKLAEQVIDYLARFPYNITQPVYQRLALHLPPGALTKLKAVINDGRQDYQARYFKTQASEMVRISELIQQID